MTAPGTDALKQLFQEWITAIPETNEGSVTPPQMMYFTDFLKNKAPNVKTIFEIGFNSGLSSSVFLSARDDIRVLSVDLGAHTYVRKAKAWIDKKFPGRHLLMIGDSTEVLPQIIELLPQYKPDMIFVDGGHFGDIPLKDLENTYKIAKPECWIVLDDTNNKHKAVIDALATCLNKYMYAILGQYNGADRAWTLLKRLS